MLVLVGIIDSAYLSYAHYQNYNDLSWSSFCAISRAVNCDTVSQSPWSVFLGLPVAMWGVFGYLFFLLFLIHLREQDDESFALWSILLVLGFIFSIVSILLGYISATKIGSYCILCLLSYTISFTLTFLCWIVWRRFGNQSLIKGILVAVKYMKARRFLSIGLTMLGGFVVLSMVLIPHYWLYNSGIAEINLETGYTEDGHPWIGAIDPELTIKAFSDYQCFQCYKMHFSIKQLIAKYPDKIRLVHHHYPLDHEFNPIISTQPFHIGSGKLALLAIAAAKQNKFWEVSDLIFQKMRTKEKTVDINLIAESAVLNAEQLRTDYLSESSLVMLQNDIREGLKNNISSTPVFIIDDHMYQGYIPSKLFDNL